MGESVLGLAVADRLRARVGGKILVLGFLKLRGEWVSVGVGKEEE